MSSIVAQSFHNNVAESVMNEIQNNTARYYYYFGNTKPAPVTVETPINSPEYIAATHNNMIMLLRVNSSDVSYVVPRVNWSSGVRYNKYESSKVGTQSNFYVLTDEFNVYKCIDNNAEGVVSTVKPTGTDIDIIRTADGYAWKFMYNVPLSLRNKFLSDIYLPVSNALRNRFYGSGEIDSVTILEPGAGYIQASTTISITGDGVNAALSPVVSGGRIISVTIDNPGTGYTYATITVNSPTATTVAKLAASLIDGSISSQQAIIENLATPGTIDSISIISAGSGYTVAPSVSIVGDGVDATAVAHIVDGALSYIEVTNPGINYTYANVTLTGAGTGAYASANVSPVFGHGRDAVKELYASNLMFYGNMAGTSVAGFDITNDYQQFGLIKNVRSTTFDMSLLDQTTKNRYLLNTPPESDLTDLVPGTTIVTDGVKRFDVISVTYNLAGNGIVEVSPKGSYVPEVGDIYSVEVPV